ncbi:hypothetical protein LZG04_23500 [Saccharothrix sp. S26]|uniref:hypothetical protein n=1 Tax=Saccharothrix sp. S26 TaxID=2907215 RepID=UPI001F3B6632|nr:hypothetical protein [Saccharothrix sp. S26]MCE6997743.1 hypothetical protein [Saccharothrix sp. S26]
MLLTRRHLFRACGMAGAATLVSGAGWPDDWFGWLRAHRQHVAVVFDGRFAHRAHERQPLAALRHVVHRAAYAEGRVEPDERVRVGEWEQYHVGMDGGAHLAALKALGLRCSNGVKADDPRGSVTAGELVSVMLRHGDFAAGDWLARRLGLAVPSFAGEVLRLVLGRAVEVERYLDDPRLRLEVLGRMTDVPRTYEGRRSWARGTWAGTAAEVSRALAGTPGGPVVGVLPGVVTVGVSTREGTAVVLAREVDEAWSARVGELVELVRTALVEPAALREFHVSLS